MIGKDDGVLLKEEKELMLGVDARRILNVFRNRLPMEEHNGKVREDERKLGTGLEADGHLAAAGSIREALQRLTGDGSRVEARQMQFVWDAWLA